jgi:HSP20 family protein
MIPVGFESSTLGYPAATPWSTWGGGVVNPYSVMLLNNQNRLGNLNREVVQPMTQLMSADIIESETDFHVHVDMPGVENIDVQIDSGYLTIAADRRIMHERDSDIAHTVERSFGKVKRRLPLPSNADVDNARARFVDGVLTVSFPKTESSHVKKLVIL